jgi:predicted nucleic acid-binding protein
MLVVSNASPLITLARGGWLHLIGELYSRVRAPEQVWREVVVEGVGRPGAAQLAAADWVVVQPARDRRRVALLALRVDAGEAEAIALALELRADLLLMDEAAGRAAARELGLRVTGVAGILLAAKRRGLLPAVKPVLDELRANEAYRLAEGAYRRTLRAAGEWGTES